MLFSSLVFLFLFLPLCLIIYHALPKKKLIYRNIFLLIVSLFFYAWGGTWYILLMISVITVNYLGALWISKNCNYEKNNCDNKTETENQLKRKKIKLFLLLFANLCILFYFKYFNFFISIIEGITSRDINIFEVLLPIGISFYLFQAMSYVIDVYNEKVKAQKNFLKLSLYISLFPALIAGPIIKYADLEQQINNREHTSHDFYHGIKRFIYGLAKKVLVANTLGEVADSIFLNHPSTLGINTAWIGIIFYALQIYYDFSGYSCMAIGLSKMFGFKIKENFNYPYISVSITEFWRRWHISLTSWFREYVYYPLGGNRKGTFRTYINIIIIFLVSGLWHGANYTFIIWGAFYAFFLVIERIFVKQTALYKPNFFNWSYTIVVVLVAWVFFRSPDMGYALQYIKAMFGYYGYNGLQTPSNYLTMNSILILPFALLFCGFIQSWTTKLFSLKAFEKIKTKKSVNAFLFFIEAVFLFGLYGFVLLMLANKTYNPFIYFQF
ncbi:MAG: MBOAT family protein [Treponema sp.]|nr:MBOAT family protein [Treponema sp.]MCL2250524.1 MBOAT family protein [Treponema sp.]